MLKVGEEVIITEYGCGVRKGDNLAPTLFIVVMQLTSEDIISKLKEEKSCMKNVKYDNNNGLMRLHKQKYLPKMNKKRNKHAYLCG